jgi:hypothetical protein
LCIVVLMEGSVNDLSRLIWVGSSICDGLAGL